MGGWSQNGRSTTKHEYIEMISYPNTGIMVFVPQSQRESQTVKLELTGGSWAMDGIKSAFQMVRPKKVEYYMTGIRADDGTTAERMYSLQVILSKWKEDGIGDTPLNVVPGAQTKMFDVYNQAATGSENIPTHGETEIMRIACFYPPLNGRLEKTGSGAIGEGILSTSWIDTNGISGVAPAPYWNCFGIAVNKVLAFQYATTISIDFFMECTWECKSRKWFAYRSETLFKLSDEEKELIKSHPAITDV